MVRASFSAALPNRCANPSPDAAGRDADAADAAAADGVAKSAPMGGGQENHPEVVAVLSRVAAVQEQRKALIALDDKAPGALGAGTGPIVAALRSLVAEFEDLADDHSAVIAGLRREAQDRELEASHSRRRYDSLKSALRQSVEKNVAAARRAEAQATTVVCLRAMIHAIEASNAKTAAELLAKNEKTVARLNARIAALTKQAGVDAKRREGDVAVLEERLTASRKEAAAESKRHRRTAAGLESRIADFDEARVQAWAASKEQLEMIAALEAKVQGSAREVKEGKRVVAGLEAQLLSMEGAVLEATESARRADGHTAAQRTAAAASAADAERAREEAESALSSVQSLRELSDGLESRLDEVSMLREEERAAAEDVAVRAKADRESCELLREQVANLQAVCTNYASAIALASHRRSSSRGAELQTHAGRSPLTEAATNGDTRRASAPRTEKLAGKYKLRVDVPAFQPGEPFPGRDENALGRAPGAGLRLNHSYPNLFWCPPGTSAATLASAVHGDDAGRVQVLEVMGDRWADGAALWFDLANALIPDAGCASNPHPEDSTAFWQAVETAFLSVGADDDEEAPAPIVVVIRKAAMLVPTYDNEAIGGHTAEARRKIGKTVEVLHTNYASLAADRFSVAVILEGWPAYVSLGNHVAQSLALPRVSRRSGKSKRCSRKHASVLISC